MPLRLSFAPIKKFFFFKKTVITDKVLLFLCLTKILNISIQAMYNTSSHSVWWSGAICLNVIQFEANLIKQSFSLSVECQKIAQNAHKQLAGLSNNFFQVVGYISINKTKQRKTAHHNARHWFNYFKIFTSTLKT